MSAPNPILQSMVKRDRERKLVNEKNQLAKDEKSEKEGTDFFDSMFNKKVIEIDQKLDSLQSSEDNITIQDEFVAIAKSLQELQKYFTGSTIFLTDRKIQQCQNTINKLVTKSDETKARIVPKKKFGFKNKPVVVQVDTEETPFSDNSTKNSSDQSNISWTETLKSNHSVFIDSENSNNKDLTLNEMQNCLIIIKGNPGSLQMSKMKNCLLLCGPVSRSIFVDASENCTFAFTCQQLRIHSTVSCNIYMHVTSRAIIEDSREICVAPTTYTYDSHIADLENSGLTSINNWDNVGDFNWLSTEKSSPNWSVIPNEEKIMDWSSYIEEFKMKNKIA